MRQKQFPPQTGAYQVRVKSGQSTDNWQVFGTARMQISVGQSYHEGDKLKALAEWCAARFDQTDICVNDTLQRFNLMYENGVNENSANRDTYKLGDDWLDRNVPLFPSDPGIQIIRWDQWKAGPSYEGTALKTKWLYAANPEFRRAIDENITALWKRRQNASPQLYTQDRLNEFADLSRRYLLEEAAVFSVMFDTKSAIDIYPGTALFAVTLFRGRDVPGAPPGLGKGHFCRVDFARNPNYAPQTDNPEPGAFGC